MSNRIFFLVDYQKCWGFSSLTDDILNAYQCVLATTVFVLSVFRSTVYIVCCLCCLSLSFFCVCVCGCVYSWPMYSMCTKMTNKRPYVASLCMHQMKWAAFHCHCLIAFFPLISISLFLPLAPITCVYVCANTLYLMPFAFSLSCCAYFDFWPLILGCVRVCFACLCTYTCVFTHGDCMFTLCIFVR